MQNNSLDNVLKLTDSILNRKYLSSLSDVDVCQLESLPSSDIFFDISRDSRIFHLKRFVYDPNENFLSKLITVVNVAYALKGTIITSIQSTGEEIRFYIGILAKQQKGNSKKDERDALMNAFEGTILGNFIGSDLGKPLKGASLEEFKEAISGNAICSVSAVPSLRDEDIPDIKSYVQGIENLVDALKGKKYTILTISDPVSQAEIAEIRHGYERIYNHLLPLYKVVEVKGTADTVNITETETQNYVRGITEGISKTQSTSYTTSSTNGFHAGINLGVSIGFQHGKSRGTAETMGRTDSDSYSWQSGKGTARSSGAGHTTSDSTQVFAENRMIKSMLDKIEKNIQRLDACETYGGFQSAAYVLADDRETALNAAGNFASLIKGENAASQASSINCWENKQVRYGDSYAQKEADAFSKTLNWLKYFAHPVFRWKDDAKSQTTVDVTTAVMVSGSEVTVQLGFTKKSVNCVSVLPMYPFGRNVTDAGVCNREKKLLLGNLYHMGQEEGDGKRAQKVPIDIESLSMHTFITGSTGAGKSTTIYSMLDKLMNKGIRFMVIEPAKGEYKNRFGSYPNVKVYGTNDKKMPLLRMDPFSFPEDIHVLEHIDRLIEIFNVCWPMYAAMPAVLKDAIERAYIVSGWNLDTSDCKYMSRKGKPLYPSFLDVLGQIHVVMEESAYSSDNKGNYKGALCTRIKSLTNGLYRQIFTNNELSPEELFDSNVIVDLSRTGSSETKALLMGLLVMKLQEHRLANAAGGNEPLKHMTVLEEAHHILKRTSTEQTGEGANLLGKAVEMLANSIAEMRTYGEGFIIADQTPGQMDLSVIRNTNTKIILRLPDLCDRELVGRAAGLNEGQIEELSRLKTFVAAVYQNDWLEPVLCKIDTDFKKVSPFRFSYSAKPTEENLVYRFLKYLLCPLNEREKECEKADCLIDDVYKLSIPMEVKTSFIRYTDSKVTEWEEAKKICEDVMYHIFNIESAWKMAKSKGRNIVSWYECIKNLLEPDITTLLEYEQRKIIAILTKRMVEQDEGENDLLNHLMSYYKRRGMM